MKAKRTATKRKKLYVGIHKETRKRIPFRSSSDSEAVHGHEFSYLIGPFRTPKAAKIMAAFGGNNPHLQTVYDAEKMARHPRHGEEESIAHVKIESR